MRAMHSLTCAISACSTQPVEAPCLKPKCHLRLRPRCLLCTNQCRNRPRISCHWLCRTLRVPWRSPRRTRILRRASRRRTPPCTTRRRRSPRRQRCTLPRAHICLTHRARPRRTTARHLCRECPRYRRRPRLPLRNSLLLGLRHPRLRSTPLRGYVFQ